MEADEGMFYRKEITAGVFQTVPLLTNQQGSRDGVLYTAKNEGAVWVRPRHLPMPMWETWAELNSIVHHSLAYTKGGTGEHA